MPSEEQFDNAVARIASAIGEPARARILYCLMDGRARTSTELATVAEVCPSTTSVHLNRLKAGRLVRVQAQGKHRYYCLGGPDVGSALEALGVLASGSRRFVPKTPMGLRAARTCYDHLAGAAGVSLLDGLLSLGWLETAANDEEGTYDLTAEGTAQLGALGIDIDATRALRRRFACACLDWSERRPHVGGALGAAILKITLKRRWMLQEVDGRALEVTSLGRREILNRFGVWV